MRQAGALSAAEAEGILAPWLALFGKERAGARKPSRRNA
jgi:hypothetical protein